MTKTREQLVEELRASMADVPENESLSKEAFVQAAATLIERGEAMWDGKFLCAIQGGKQ